MAGDSERDSDRASGERADTARGMVLPAPLVAQEAGKEFGGRWLASGAPTVAYHVPLRHRRQWVWLLNIRVEQEERA